MSQDATLPVARPVDPDAPDVGAPSPRGSLELLVRSSVLVAEDVVKLDLVRADGQPLPVWSPGAHIDLVLPSGKVRPYSLCGDSADTARFEVAVLREPTSRGGSLEVHETGLVGKVLTVRGPRNNFSLVGAPSYLFLAGGIGVTPLLSMARQVARAGAPWRFVYGGRTSKKMAFLDELHCLPGGNVQIIAQDEAGLPPFEQILGDAADGTAVYCCGPAGMLDAVQSVSQRLLPPGALHLERFTAPTPPAVEQLSNTAFEVELARSGVVAEVPADRSILDVVLDHVPQQLYSCEEGYCGTCATRVLAGEPHHRDSVLTPAERMDTMMICVGRSLSARLVLDL